MWFQGHGGHAHIRYKIKVEAMRDDASLRMRWPWKSLLSHLAITCLSQNALIEPTSSEIRLFGLLLRGESHSPLMSVMLAWELARQLKSALDAEMNLKQA